MTDEVIYGLTEIGFLEHAGSIRNAKSLDEARDCTRSALTAVRGAQHILRRFSNHLPFNLYRSQAILLVDVETSLIRHLAQIPFGATE